MSLIARLGTWAAPALLAGLCAAGLGTPVSAQEIGQDALSYLGTFAFADSLHTWDQVKEYGAETVLDHTRDGFRPNGLMLPGGHMLYPVLAAKTMYDDNIFLDRNKVGDLRSSVAGSTEFQSNLPRHMFKIRADGEFVDFKDHPNLNFVNGNVRADWRIDIDAADTIGGTFQSQLGHNDNFLPIAPDNTSEAIPIWVNRGAIGYMHDAGRTALATGIDWQRTQIFNVPTYGGGTADEAAGDNDILGAFAYLSYRWSPGYRAFLATRVDREVLLHERAAYGNNYSYRAETGLVYEFDPLLQLTLSAGYQYIKFDDSTQFDIGSPSIKGSLQWLPTQRMTVNFDISQQLQRTVDGPTFGELADAVHGRVQYDIYHNLTGALDLTLQRDQYIGSDRVDNLWDASASVDYLFNENLALTLAYEHIDRNSNDDKYDFNDNRLMATLKFSE